MTLQEAERLAALWCAGQPPEDLPQWRTVMQTILREVDIARHQLKIKGLEPDAPCATCVSLARAVMMDQTGNA